MILCHKSQPKRFAYGDISISFVLIQLFLILKNNSILYLHITEPLKDLP